MPEYNVGQIVGWVGTGMLIMSLTGLRLWWPRRFFARLCATRASARFVFIRSSRAYPDHVSMVELTLVYHNLLRQ
jgi:uncharacterized iron-regulated membrane protein